MERTFTEIIRRHSPLIRSIIAKYIMDKMEADDVYQEISIHILSKLSKTNANEISRWESSAWITTITKNKILDILRTKKSIISDRNNVNFDKIPFNQLNSENVINSSKELLKISVTKLLMNLTENERELILLRFVHSHSMTEIGELLNLRNPSVNLRRVLDKLKNELNGKDFFEMYDGFVFEDNVL